MSMPMSQEAWDEMEAERTAWPMTQSDEHHYWHAINGPGNCPWDAAQCQPPEPEQCSWCGEYLDAPCENPDCITKNAEWLAQRVKETAALPADDDLPF